MGGGGGGVAQKTLGLEETVGLTARASQRTAPCSGEEHTPRLSSLPYDHFYFDRPFFKDAFRINITYFFKCRNEIEMSCIDLTGQKPVKNIS